MTGRATVRHGTTADRAARSARAWSFLARGIFAVLILATLAFGAFLAIANDSLRNELADAHDDLATSRAESAALYEQINTLGERPVVTPGRGGPECPVGYSIAFVWLSLSGDEVEPLTRQPAAVCRPTP